MCLINAFVLRACVNSLIKTLHFFNCQDPIARRPDFQGYLGNVPDVGRCCNQPLSETQSLREESVSKYHKCALEPQKAVQPS